MDHCERIRKRWSALKNERSSWEYHWREISEHLLPRSGLFNTGDRNNGKKKHSAIIDSTPTRALRVLSAGLMSGMTSPARPWFRLTLDQINAEPTYAVRAWTAEVTRLMLDVFQRSNLYRSLHMLYEELGAYGTAAMIILPDYDDIIRCYPLTAGQYAIATDSRGQVNALYREFDMTVGQLMEEFGEENVSANAMSQYRSGNLDAWVTVIHAIEPRKNYDAEKMDSMNMPYMSCYMEAGASEGKCLRESGFRNFPAVAPRWAASGGDVYGNGPGMEALGDIKQLQHEQLRKAQGIDYQTNPPLQVPSNLKNRDIDILPGGVSFVDMTGPQNSIRTAFEVGIDLNHLLADINDVRARINATFYADLFLMIANQADKTMTATEVAERHEEKLLMLGPVLERLQNELLDPLVELTFTCMMEAGIVPPPPQELQGKEISIEFVSMLAQAQKAIGVNSIDRFVTTLVNISQAKPEILDRINADALADKLQDHLGVDPDLLVPLDQADSIRQARAQAQQAQEQAAMMQQASVTARNLAQSDTAGQNALTDVAGMFNGYMQPGVLQ